MNTYFVINLENYKLKKAHPYTIFFETTCPTFCHEKFELEYSATDLRYMVSLPSDYMDKVLEEMVKIFGYGPFDRKGVKQALGTHCQIRIAMSKGEEEK